MARVSVVVPTVGRRSLQASVTSALQQSFPVHEVVVSSDTHDPLDLDHDPRVRVVVGSPGSGAQAARQAGVRHATGDVIALLDDDDLWHPYKVEAQLESVSDAGDRWIASCRCVFRYPDGRERVLPPRVVLAREDIATYLYTYRVGRGGTGNGMVQSSTLMFPRELAVQVPFDSDPAAPHHEATWLLAVRQRFPSIPLIQSRESWVVYDARGSTSSASGEAPVMDHVRWGAQYLASSTPRVRGDYGFTVPVAAAYGAGSVAGIGAAARATWSSGGRPGPLAAAYCAAKAGVLTARRWGR